MLVISPLVPVASVGCANTAALSENCPNSRLARRETPLARRSPQRFAWGPSNPSHLQGPTLRQNVRHAPRPSRSCGIRAIKGEAPQPRT